MTESDPPAKVATSAGLGPTPPPAPAGFRTRYRSDPGMVGHYPWTYADAGRRKGNRPECEYEDLFTADQMRAYAAQEVAAERQRCAKLCEDRAIHRSGPYVVTLEMNQMALAIRGEHDFRA